MVDSLVFGRGTKMTKKYNKRRTYKRGKFISFNFTKDYAILPKYRRRRVINVSAEEKYNDLLDLIMRFENK